MRLINTATGRLEVFLGRNVPKYAILSHTWSEEEVSFQDFADAKAHSMAGYPKIEATCRLASDSGFNYAWVDTCCIDKTSSAELSEAINSMYRWYQRAEVCFVYLSDLEPGHLDSSLSQCRWFTRGWTLQELIAPTKLLFFDKEWNLQSSKEQMVKELSAITSIGIDILRHTQPLSTVPVAEKMAWAAHRETTRVEDIAYCLLGIFDLNMPLLYGEEDKAFQRLQQEIMKSTADLSIFAWKLPGAPNSESKTKDRVYCGVLADSPRAFFRQFPLIRIPKYARREFSMSNIGIKAYVHVLSRAIPGSKAYQYVLPLDCADHHDRCFGVLLRKCGVDKFLREDPWTILEDVNSFPGNAAKGRYLLTHLPGYQPQNVAFSIAQTRSHVLQIQDSPNVHLYDAWPWSRYDDEDQLFFVGDDPEWDSAILRLVIHPFPTTPGQQRLKFECIFYAIGWSRSSRDEIQCSFVDYKEYYTAVTEIQTQINTWDGNSTMVLQALAHHDVPKSSSVVFRVPDSNLNISVSCDLTQVTDLALCQNPFWRLKFSSTTFETKHAPETYKDTWQIHR